MVILRGSSLPALTRLLIFGLTVQCQVSSETESLTVLCLWFFKFGGFDLGYSPAIVMFTFPRRS